MGSKFEQGYEISEIKCLSIRNSDKVYNIKLLKDYHTMLASISQAIAAGKSDTPVTCDPIVPIENFDESKYAGNWYEQ